MVVQTHDEEPACVCGVYRGLFRWIIGERNVDRMVPYCVAYLFCDVLFIDLFPGVGGKSDAGVGCVCWEMREASKRVFLIDLENM